MFTSYLGNTGQARQQRLPARLWTTAAFGPVNNAENQRQPSGFEQLIQGDQSLPTQSEHQRELVKCILIKLTGEK